MKRATYALPLLAAVVLLGCQQAAPSVDTAAIQNQLKGLEQQWSGDYAARDANALAAHYAPDAALANPGSRLATDALTRRSDIAAFAADPNLKVQFASDRVQVAASGDLAYTRGHYTMQSTDAATKQPRSDSGSYLTVWQKQADGSWKAVEDFSTPGPAAPATP